MLSPAVQRQRPAASLAPLTANRVEAVGADEAVPRGGDANGGAISQERVGLDGCGVVGRVVDIGRRWKPNPVPSLLAKHECLEVEGVAARDKSVEDVESIGAIGGFHVGAGDGERNRAVNLGFVKAGSRHDREASGITEHGVASGVHAEHLAIAAAASSIEGQEIEPLVIRAVCFEPEPGRRHSRDALHIEP
uniref:Uncharacterized protein n=1 Tax=Triticum urartu TaxID=4572 RepID=A0A8R7QH70_TRIUA